MLRMFAYSRRLKSGQITCYLNRTYHVASLCVFVIAKVRQRCYRVWPPMGIAPGNSPTRRLRKEDIVKTHSPTCQRQFLGAAEILSFVALFCLVGGNASGQLSQSAATLGLAKTTDASSTGVIGGVSADAASRSRLVAAYGKLPLSFEANQGQTNSEVKFLSRGRGYTLFLTGNEAVLALNKAEIGGGTRKPEFGTRLSPLATRHAASVLRMSLVGASESVRASGLEELSGKSNYFIGNDPKKWRTDVANYAKVRYQNVYPGVDLVYYGNQGKLEYDFVVAPGANPTRIKLDVMAALGVRPSSAAGGGKSAHVSAPLRIAANGDLVVSLSGGEVRFHKPVVYQELDASLSSQQRESGHKLVSTTPIFRRPLRAGGRQSSNFPSERLRQNKTIGHRSRADVFQLSWRQQYR